MAVLKIRFATNVYPYGPRATLPTIIVDKSSQKITSEMGAVGIDGASADGTSFSCSGTITFTGNDTATLVFASGTSYIIVW